MHTIIQLAALLGLLIAVTALTDWRWALLIAAVIVGAVSTVLEHRKET